MCSNHGEAPSRLEPRPCIHGAHRFRGLSTPLVVTAMASYYRAELDYALDIDEVAMRMINASDGKMVGKHYSLQYWKGRVRRGTGSGPGREVTIGIVVTPSPVSGWQLVGLRAG